jgi:hypothetical protein
MRLAFVIRLGNDTRPAEGLFEGWVEEVDTCTERRFRSTEELLKFLGQRFDLAMDSADPARGNIKNERGTPTKKNPRKGRKSS